MSTAIETEKKVVVRSFVVEADGKRNDDILIQNIPNCRLRSRILSNRPAKNSRTGRITVPKDQAMALGALPELPGMRIAVNPAKREVVITDPLHDNEEMCKQIQHFLESNESNMAIIDGRIDGVPTRKETLDVDHMKTLCRELIWLVGSDDGRVIKGVLPELEDVEKLPGHFLLNPGSRIQNEQPVYERDFEAWRQRIASRSG